MQEVQYKLNTRISMNIRKFIEEFIKNNSNGEHVMINDSIIDEFDEESILVKIGRNTRIVEGNPRQSMKIAIGKQTGYYSLYYKEYPLCCGKASIYHIGLNGNIQLSEIIHKKYSIFLFKLAMACMAVNRYTFVDYVISQHEQERLLNAIVEDGSLYDSNQMFKNIRNEHICFNFVKDLTTFSL